MTYKKNILVTGGAGYIGSQICKELFKKNYNPITYDNFSTGKYSSVKWGPYIKGNIGDKNKLAHVLKKYNPKAIFHLAALTSVPESEKFPKKYFKNNVTNSIKLIETAISHKIKYFIFSSTCSVYGNPKTGYVTEKTKTKPINKYGMGKLLIEKQLKKFYKKKGLYSVSLRYFNVAGADPDLEIGDKNYNSPKIIPKIFNSILKKKTLMIYGNKYRTYDGTCIRDYIHVKDIAECHLKALNYIFKKKTYSYFNVGAGQGYSILELINAVERVTKKRIKIHYTKKRKGDPDKIICRKIRKSIFNWQPKRSNINLIIRDAWLWYKKNRVKI